MIGRPPLDRGHHQRVNVLPRLGPGARNVAIGGVCEHNRGVTVGPKSLDVSGSILNVHVCPDSRLIGEKTKVPIRDVVSVEPLDRLLHRNPVKILNEQPVRNDADADALSGEPSQHLWGSDHRFQDSKQVALRYCATSPAPDSGRRLEAISTLNRLTDLTPLDLLVHGFNQASLEAEGKTCLNAYDAFLGLLRNSHTRARLASLTSDEADDDEVFQRVRLLSGEFQNALTALFISRVEGSANPFPVLTEVYGVF